MVLCPPFPNKEQDTGPIILVIIILQKIRYTAEPDLFTVQNRVIKKESNELEHLIFLLNKEKLDGVGEFLSEDAGD
jgi:tRNA(Glu) U13 pseudouridine synthase TruD